MPRESRPRLSDDDRAAIVVALRHMSEVHGPDIGPESKRLYERLIAKLRQIGPGRPPS